MKDIKLRGILAAFSGVLLISAGSSAMADTTSDLLDALVAKGVLTEEEAAPLMKGHEAENQNKKNEIKASFHDGIVFESSDKSTKFSVNGRVQADYHNFNPDRTGTDTWNIRRAYLGAKGTFYNDISFEVTGDFASLKGDNGSTATHLDQTYLNLGWWQAAQIKVGQFVMPFSLETITSDLNIDFMERSFIYNLTPDKERGAMVYGSPMKGLYYGLAVSNGEGKNSNLTGNQDRQNVIGRAVVNLAEIMDNKDMVLHFGADYSDGKANLIPTQSTEGQGLKFFSSTKGDKTSDYDKTRYGFETALAYGPVKFQGEYVKNEFDGGGLTSTHSMDAWYTDISWIITGEHYADAYSGGAFGRMKPKADFVHPAAANGMGAWELALRYDQFDATDFMTQALGAAAATGKTDGNFTNKAHSWTAGVKWIVNPNTRIMLGYTDTHFDTPVKEINNLASSLPTATTNDERAINVRFQFDF